MATKVLINESNVICEPCFFSCKIVIPLSKADSKIKVPRSQHCFWQRIDSQKVNERIKYTMESYITYVRKLS